MKRSRKPDDVLKEITKSTPIKKPKMSATDRFRAMFQKSEKQKYQELIEKYATKDTLDKSIASQMQKDVDSFTRSINQDGHHFGHPASSSTPFRPTIRSIDDTLNSSFDIIETPSFTSTSAVTRSLMASEEKLRLKQKIAAERNVRSVLSKRKDRKSTLEDTLFKFQSRGSLSEDESDVINDQSFSTARVKSLFPPMEETITLDDSPPKSTIPNHFSHPFWSHKESPQRCSSPPRTEVSTNYHTPRGSQTYPQEPSIVITNNRTPSQSYQQDTSILSNNESPVTKALSQSSSLFQIKHSVEKKLAEKYRSPFASRSPPTIEEIDLACSPETYRRTTPVKVDLPEATTQYKKNEEKLERAISQNFIETLCEKPEEESVIETSRIEVEKKTDEEKKKTSEIERLLRQFSFESVPEEPYLPAFHRGITGQEIVIEDSSEEEEEEEEPVLRPSEDELDEFIQNKVNKVPPGTILIEKFSIEIKRSDLETLKKLNWLNDEVMNFYFNMIQERSSLIDNYPKVYVYNTFFSSRMCKEGVAKAFTMIKRWTRKVDIFSYDVLLIPNHIQVHWTLTAVYVKKQKMSYYDSMANGRINSKGAAQMKTILEYLKMEHQDKKKSPLPDGWDIGVEGIDEDGNDNVSIPQQENGSDCGVFTCRFAEAIAKRSPFTFHQVISL